MRRSVMQWDAVKRVTGTMSHFGTSWTEVSLGFITFRPCRFPGLSPVPPYGMPDIGMTHIRFRCNGCWLHKIKAKSYEESARLQTQVQLEVELDHQNENDLNFKTSLSPVT